MSRPILIDERDGPCEHCERWAKIQPDPPVRDGRIWRKCCRCEKEIALYQNMGGAGFRAPEPHHWHLEMVIAPVQAGDPFPAKRPYYEELCMDCYYKAWAEANPGKQDYIPQPPAETVQSKIPAWLLREAQGHTALGEVA